MTLSSNPSDDFFKLDIMLPIARGMKKLHASGWFHRSLKALNILVGKGRAMVTNEDNEALAEMISPYLFLSIMIGEYENYVGAEANDFGGHQKSCKPWKKTRHSHKRQLHSTLS